MATANDKLGYDYLLSRPAALQAGVRPMYGSLAGAPLAAICVDAVLFLSQVRHTRTSLEAAPALGYPSAPTSEERGSWVRAQSPGARHSDIPAAALMGTR